MTCTKKVTSSNYQFGLNGITMPPSILASDDISVSVSRSGASFLQGKFTVTAVVR